MDNRAQRGSSITLNRKKTMATLFKKRTVSTKWKVIASSAFGLSLIVNGLAGSTTLLGGVDTAAVSDKYANIFAPAGFTFAIWAAIYLSLIGFMLYIWNVWKVEKPQLAPQDAELILKQYTAISLLNIAWLLSWQYEQLGISVILMAGLVVLLLILHNNTASLKLTQQEDYAVKMPFSIYAGWITVAAIANVTTWQVSLGWNGGGIPESAWTVVMLIVGAVVGLATALKRMDWVYLAVFIWAYSGILYKHLTVFSGEHLSVIVTLGVLLSVLSVFTVLLFTLPSRYLKS